MDCLGWMEGQEAKEMPVGETLRQEADMRSSPLASPPSMAALFDKMVIATAELPATNRTEMKLRHSKSGADLFCKHLTDSR